MKDYSNLGLNSKLRPSNGLSGKDNQYRSALEDNMHQEPTPLLHRTVVSNRGGTVQTNLGGLVDLRDTTGGTSIFTYDPDTGVITFNGPINLNGTFTLGTNTVFNGPVTFNGGMTLASQGTVTNRGIVFNGGATDGTAAVRMFNSGGTERLTWGITPTGFGFGTVDEIQFKGNTSNKINENFGVQVQLADASGGHSLGVTDSGGTKCYDIRSDGIFAMRKASFIELLGTIADPGGGASNTARLYVRDNGSGKKQLAVEFPTGTAIPIATEP